MSGHIRGSVDAHAFAACKKDLKLIGSIGNGDSHRQGLSGLVLMMVKDAEIALHPVPVHRRRQMACAFKLLRRIGKQKRSAAKREGRLCDGCGSTKSGKWHQSPNLALLRARRTAKSYP